ncbi:MAG: hypothetical protein FWC90_03045 [Oscillospiraceae bacterium]|nr:hypothetical protein [Oscillospiraceae bacterium]
MSQKVRLALLVVFAVLIVVFLVFIIQTLLLNRSSDDPDPVLPVSLIHDDIDEDDPIDDIDDASSESEEAEHQTRPTVPPNIWIPLLDDSDMTLYIPAGEFDRHDTDTGALFAGLGGASLEISLVPVGNDVAVFARGFLDPFLDFTDFVTEGLINIASSNISGYFVMVYNDDETYEAWIHDLGGGFGVAVIINYTNYTQRDALYDILDTLAIDN